MWWTAAQKISNQPPAWLKIDVLRKLWVEWHLSTFFHNTSAMLIFGIVVMVIIGILLSITDDDGI